MRQAKTNQVYVRGNGLVVWFRDGIEESVWKFKTYEKAREFALYKLIPSLAPNSTRLHEASEELPGAYFCPIIRHPNSRMLTKIRRSLLCNSVV